MDIEGHLGQMKVSGHRAESGSVYAQSLSDKQHSHGSSSVSSRSHHHHHHSHNTSDGCHKSGASIDGPSNPVGSEAASRSGSGGADVTVRTVIHVSSN